MAAKKRQKDAPEVEVNEVVFSEYLILIFAISVYARHVQEKTDRPANDEQTHKGVGIARLIDSQYGEAFEADLLAKITAPATQAMLKQAFSVRLTGVHQVLRRALSLRTALNRSAANLKAVFDESRPRNAVKASIASYMTDPTPEAFARFLTVPVRNTHIKAWLKKTSEIIGSEEVIHNPVENAAAAALDQVQDLKDSKLAEQATTSADEVKQIQTDRTVQLQQLQDDATKAAAEALQVAGKEDKPLKHSEIIGVATAAAAAVASDPTHSVNVPASLKTLDDEQREAAVTDGQVLVVAGAGAGKSTTAIARVKYLVEEKGVPPEKIMMTSFNRKAAKELEAKIIKALGPEKGKRVTVGTMHSIFRQRITKFGSASEKLMFSGPTHVLTGATIASTVNQIWRKCFAKWDDYDKKFKNADAPSAKAMMLAKTKWLSDGITPQQALESATTSSAKTAAHWFAMYESLKGRGPWPEGCTGDVKSVEANVNRFTNDFRTSRDSEGEKFEHPIGDYDDMIRVFGDMLERDPKLRAKAQNAYPHIIVDECQDLNPEQYRAFKYLTEHVAAGKPNTSFWMVGDPDQSIYAFRGARPEHFVALDGKEDWKTKFIRTNYRCPPEVVEAANRLIAHNTNRMDKVAVPGPNKPRGEASIDVGLYKDDTSTALSVASGIEARWDHGNGVPAQDNAILCATNAELDSFELALLSKGIPYARKGASSFLSSPETKAFLGYMTLATDTDAQKGQEALAQVLNKPNRIFVNDEKELKSAVQYAVNNYAQAKGVTRGEVDPIVAMRDPRFRSDLISSLGKTSQRSAPRMLEALSDHLSHLSTLAQDDATTTQEMFNAILETPGIDLEVDPTNPRKMLESTVTFREALMRKKQDAAGSAIEADDGDDSDDDIDTASTTVGPTEGLGTISFLYEMSNTNPTDPMDMALPPDKPKGFWSKMERLKEKAGDLRYDLSKWDKEDPPPAVYLGTVHCSPADEPVLTTAGWIPIGDLDSDKHRLASYTHSCNQLFWGQVKGDHDGTAGYSFVKAVNRYEGPLLTLSTARSKTRITPDHRIRVKWSESFYNKYVVYLMRRGDWWRVGLAKSGNRPYGGSDFKQRVSAERADACWILSVHASRTDAVLEEARVQGHYGVTGLTFEASSQRRVSSDQIQAVHESIKDVTRERVFKLLDDYGLDKKHPLYTGQNRDNDMRSAFDIQARNCLSGYMLLPVVSEAFVECTGPREVWTKPEWHEVSVTKESFAGDVYSLVVLPHRYYVSGGAIVHNSVKGAQWPYVTVQMPEGRFPMPSRHDEEDEDAPPDSEAAARVAEQESKDMEASRRLAYVALTRSSKDLQIVAPEKINGKKAGLSRFVTEAGLVPGENVNPPAEASKTSSFFFEDLRAF